MNTYIFCSRAPRAPKYDEYIQRNRVHVWHHIESIWDLRETINTNKRRKTYIISSQFMFESCISIYIYHRRWRAHTHQTQSEFRFGQTTTTKQKNKHLQCDSMLLLRCSVFLCTYRGLTDTHTATHPYRTDSLNTFVATVELLLSARAHTHVEIVMFASPFIGIGALPVACVAFVHCLLLGSVPTNKRCVFFTLKRRITYQARPLRCTIFRLFAFVHFEDSFVHSFVKRIPIPVPAYIKWDGFCFVFFRMEIEW